MTQKTNINLIRLALLIYCLVVFYIVINTVTSYNSTGELNVVSTDKKANLIITQTGHQALSVGTGSTKLRLKPGVYQIYAFDSGRQADYVISVNKKHTDNITVGPLSSFSLPTLQDTKFSGINSFLNYGMPSSQLSALEMALFKFSPSINNVSVNTSSINYAAFNPDSSSTLSTVNFVVSIGVVQYNAECTYDNLGSYLDLKLYSLPSNTQVYDSNS